MGFVVKTPTFGAQIRVNRGLYYHHGIYIDDLNVIHFGSLTNELNPNDAMVIKTSLSEFLKGGEVEVREYTKEEEKLLRTPNDIVNTAFLKLGEKGYNILSNNCEHLSNYCAFAVAKSSQVEKVESILKSILNK